MNRRGFFATIAAAIAPKPPLAAPQIQPVQFHWPSGRINEYWILRCKIGDTIIIG